jgi:hypothetical protein
MNPALQNYLQNQQQQQATPQPQQQQQPYNPFDAGIQKAIASARQSLGMTADQEEAAFNKGLLAFGDRIAETPPERGFWNNLASAGRALSPGIRAYDESEAASLAENQNLANQILKYQAEEQDRQAKAEQTAWERQHATNQLAETRRAHDMLYGSMGARGAAEQTNQEQSAESSATSNILDNAEKILKEDLKEQKTYKGRASDFLARFTPGGYIPTKEHAKVNALGDVLRGKLFNVWGYRNRAEFEHVPSISANYPPEVNLETIKTLKELFKKATLENAQNPQQAAAVQSPQNQEHPRENKASYTPDESSVLLYNPKTDEETWAHPDDVAKLKKLGGWQEA